MGMYDHITVSRKLMPGGMSHDFAGQTKSLDCVMADYELRDNGVLYCTRESWAVKRISRARRMRWTGELVFYADGPDYLAIIVKGKLYEPIRRLK